MFILFSCRTDVNHIWRDGFLESGVLHFYSATPSPLLVAGITPLYLPTNLPFIDEMLSYFLLFLLGKDNPLGDAHSTFSGCTPSPWRSSVYCHEKYKIGIRTASNLITVGSARSFTAEFLFLLVTMQPRVGCCYSRSFLLACL